jgi:hypothetical protein
MCVPIGNLITAGAIALERCWSSTDQLLITSSICLTTKLTSDMGIDPKVPEGVVQVKGNKLRHSSTSVRHCRYISVVGAVGGDAPTPESA